MAHLFNMLYYLSMIGQALTIFSYGYLPQYGLTLHFAGMDYFGLQFIDRGGLQLRIDDRDYELEGCWMWDTYPDAAFHLAPSPQHGYWSHRYITFRGAVADSLAAEGLLPFPPLPLEDAVYWAAQMDSLMTFAARQDRHGRLRAANLLEGLVLEIAELHQPASTHPAWLPELLVRLQHETPDAIDYAALAVECRMSVSSLRRHFKAAMGLPIHTYVLQKRIEQACELLHTTDLPIKAIAQHLGYSDHYYFYRQFRHLTGITPAAYRRSDLRPVDMSAPQRIVPISPSSM